jgi:hypothetical protein
MQAKKTKKPPSWSDVKAKLSNFDRVKLMAVLQDLYAASKDNQAFLHARFDLGNDPLGPYKEAISRWVCPDVLKNQTISVAKAKKAIADYKKAMGRSEGMAELTTFYCEEVFRLLRYCSVDDEGYDSALVRMFEQALKSVLMLPEPERVPLMARLTQVRAAGQKLGWGVGYDFDALWEQAGLST